MKLVQIKRDVKAWYWQWLGRAGFLHIAGAWLARLLFESNMAVVIKAITHRLVNLETLRKSTSEREAVCTKMFCLSVCRSENLETTIGD